LIKITQASSVVKRVVRCGTRTTVSIVVEIEILAALATDYKISLCVEIEL
jgi:hypothetical protein